VAVPVVFGLTLAVNLMLGFTINRVTLFALIFSIGILVDDAIVVVENMVRHFRLPENHGRPMSEVAVEAVAEVGNPTILATFAVIAAVLPMAFVRGLMGPYMRPIPVGASAAMLFSLLVAFVITPWAAVRFLRSNSAKHEAGEAEDRSTRFYRWFMGKVLSRDRNQWLFLGMVVVLLLASFSMVYFKLVIVKMLPFDNKSEFQVIVDMPEGTSLEKTAAATRELAARLNQIPEITDYVTYIGTASPFNFNGLVRHYFMRRGPTVADIQMNLVGKDERSDQSHAIAKRIRADYAENTHE